MNKQNTEKLPKVSIIIPVYNGKKYLKYAIESAIAQTYKNLEIIVVDDGSTDGTERIAKSYGEKIRYYKKENGGVSSALNFAIKKMKGEYFSWLSHDDTYEPNKISAEIEYLKEHNYIGKKIIAFSDYYLINEKGQRIHECKKDHIEVVRKPEYIIAKGHINGLTLLIPKKAFDDYGDFDTNLACVQDYEMWRLMSQTYKFVHVPRSLVSTRCHSKQTTNTNPKVITEGNDFYIKLIEGIPKERKVFLEGSEYCFYEELANFYKNTVYKAVAEYCKKQMKKILKEAKKETERYKVSVIIPFYNRSKKLERALESVFCQTHKNLEIILVDDGSNDNRDKIYKIIDKHNNITLIENEKNLGPSVSRNKGIKAATGDYLAFLDSDDEFEDTKLEVCLQYAAATNAKFLHTSYKREDNAKETVMHSGKDFGHCERKLMYNCPIATPTVMINREWLLEKEKLFNENIQIGEDVCFWLELMKNDTYLVGIDKPLTIVHVGTNASAYSNKKQIIGYKSIITYLLCDEYYSQFDQELTIIMRSYIDCIGQEELDDREKRMKKRLENSTKIDKLLFFIKEEGLKSATKRTIKKIKKH